MKIIFPLLSKNIFTKIQIKPNKYVFNRNIVPAPNIEIWTENLKGPLEKIQKVKHTPCIS